MGELDCRCVFTRRVAGVLLTSVPTGRWIGGYLLGMKASYKEFED